jgi:hypothetical protein
MEPMQSLGEGAHVRLEGLKGKSHLNGCTGVICGSFGPSSFDPSSKLCRVIFDHDGCVIQLSSRNLRASTDVPVRYQPSRTPPPLDEDAVAVNLDAFICRFTSLSVAACQQTAPKHLWIRDQTQKQKMATLILSDVASLNPAFHRHSFRFDCIDLPRAAFMQLEALKEESFHRARRWLRRCVRNKYLIEKTAQIVSSNDFLPDKLRCQRDLVRSPKFRYVITVLQYVIF